MAQAQMKLKYIVAFTLNESSPQKREQKRHKSILIHMHLGGSDIFESLCMLKSVDKEDWIPQQQAGCIWKFVECLQQEWQVPLPLLSFAFWKESETPLRSQLLRV